MRCYDKLSSNKKTSKALIRLMKNITIHTLWIYVLAVLAKEQTYPYQVKKKIKELFLFNPPTVTLYTVIYRLEREGFIKKAENGSYMITETGKNALKDASKILMEISDKLNHM
jgi:DNA-binding PadR family transcriptional regulator